ncbi:uncharacterized mitochondrial protein AtMg00860-like [Vigna umbellata]|uniref:uncharacterized mitochondrial protein AtMg00860-like n=1 Tax=Vigna umbellata TaxID=87088 RepID=UPI001F5E87BC|nr:uncharacterized mitochondrial protein AtMg00860-like [Vigna umbellata]
MRPYKYSYHQKKEIVRQVQELIKVGHIRHNQSAYSSLVILVKKKNNKWRMCVDYRDLNKATIPDKFPIPVIEELFWEEHMQFLEKVLEVLGDHQLFANKEKCLFGHEKVEYLRHIISIHGVEMDPTKVSSVLEWTIPKNVKGVRGFLGLTGYYRKFIKDYGKIAKPLTKLTRKDGFR